MHTRVNSFGISCAQIDLRKARERELATLDEKPTSSEIAEPYAIKIEGKNRGGEGTTAVTTACPEAGSRRVRKKQNIKKGHTFSRVEVT